MNNHTNNIMNRQYHFGWRNRDRRRRLALPLQRRIVATIVALAGDLPITAECLLHNGLEGINGQQIFTVATSSGVKIVVIQEEFSLLFRFQDLLPHLQQLYNSS